MQHKKLPLVLAIGLVLNACGGGGSGSSSNNLMSSGGTCPEVDTNYACQSGASEPLYTYQWALNHVKSFFATFTGVSDGTTDLVVEDVHTAGIKGQGVNVLVLDDGLDISNEDLSPNVKRSMSYNFTNMSDDPTPTGIDEAHGTNAAGIIAAAQNGKGVMGIAPRVNLGGANFVGNQNADVMQAYGGASWSMNAHVINASYGSNPVRPPDFNAASAANTAIRAFPSLRGNKGLIMVKASGNEYQGINGRTCVKVGGDTGSQITSCENPVNDTEFLEPLVIGVASLNAKGRKASYSNAGSINWVTGIGGEGSAIDQYGEGGSVDAENGPQIFSTDLSGCDKGYSRNGLTESTDFLTGGSAIQVAKNPNCNYSYMNGTSAATPTVAGVVALMLQANPQLSWRDVRFILAKTARKIDPNYASNNGLNRSVSLATYTFGGSANSSNPVLSSNDNAAIIERGWITNAAGFNYSNWYGFGLVDAKAAVSMAKTYTNYLPSTAYAAPTFTPITTTNTSLTYSRVTELGSFNSTSSAAVDMIQLQIERGQDQTQPLCVGSVGFYLQSPSGTVSALSVPNNIYQQNDVDLPTGVQYVQGSFAFYGESARGTWKVFAVSTVPNNSCSNGSFDGAVKVSYNIIPMTPQ